MALKLDVILDALSRLDCNPQETGAGQFKAKCPSHEDTNPSLSLTDKGDKILLKCHTGCSYREILTALDLWGKGGKAPIHKSDNKTPGPLPTGPGVTIYRYQSSSGAEVLAAVRRDTGDSKKFSQWIPKGDGWIPSGLSGAKPLYRLPVLLAAKDQRVVIVEGEKCVHAAEKVFTGVVFTTWAGGSKATKAVDWTPLKDRHVTLLADADEPGRKCMREVGGKLLELGVASLKIALPEGSSHDDIADWIAAGTHKTKLKELVRPFTPEDAPETRPIPSSTELEKNSHYEILGLLGERVAVRIDAGQLLMRTREACCKPDTLIAFAAQTWWQGFLEEGSNLSATSARMLGDQLLRIADRKGPLDMGHIFERGAIKTPSGRVYWHLGDRILTKAGEEHPLEWATEGIWLAGPKVTLEESATHAERRAVKDAIMGYRWQTEEDAKCLLGWMVTALVGGALDWRPHLLFHAQAGSGKSWILKNVLGRLFGPLAIKVSDPTAASLARVMRSGSLPLVVDEAEIDAAAIRESLKLLRSAAGEEGVRLRASEQEGVVSYSPRFSALLSFTRPYSLPAADAQRFRTLRLGPQVENWPIVRDAILASLERPERLRSGIIHDTVPIALHAARLEAEYLALGIPSREALIAAALSAGYAWWGGTGLVGAEAKTVQDSDALDALQDILAIPLRIGPEEKTVSTALLTKAYWTLLADGYGLRQDEEGGLMIAGRHRGLVRAMRRTRWDSVDLNQLLLQLDGAVKMSNPQTFGASRLRGVLLTKSVLADYGIEFAATETPEN